MSALLDIFALAVLVIFINEL